MATKPIEFRDDGEALNLEVNLHPAQLEIYNTTARYKVVVAGRRFGKTVLAAVTCIIEGLKTVNDQGMELGPDSEVLYAAPTFELAKAIFWPILKDLAAPVTQKKEENTCLLTLINGVRIRLRGAEDPDKTRGFKLRYAVLDEYADMPEIYWTEIIEPALMDCMGGALFIGTPKGKNHFYRMFHDAAGDDEWAAFNFAADSNPFLSRRELAKRRAKMSSTVLKQEIDAKFISAGQGDINSGQFTVVSKKEANVACQNGSYYMAGDLAGFETEKGKIAKSRLDETSMAVVRVNEWGDWYVYDIQHGHWNPREIALRITKIYREYHGVQIGIEKGALKLAVQPYLDDYQQEFNAYFNVEPLTHGNQKKQDRILWAIQGRAERGKIYLVEGPWNEKFLEQVDDFPDPRSHDDLLDSVAYIDQLAQVSIPDDWDDEDWAPVDEVAGY